MDCEKKPELIGPLLGYCNHRAYLSMDKKLRRYGVTPIQCRTLTYLHRQPGPVTQKQLQQHLAVKPSTVNGILDRMEEKGLIRRTADENDQRQKQVTVTEKGRELNSLVQAAFQEAEAVMVKGLRLEETEALRLLLYRVIENLEEDRTTC